MRKSLALAGATVLMSSSLIVAAPSAFAVNGNCATHQWAGGSGDGSAANPYKVGSQVDLDEVKYCMDKSFVQTTDIALTGNWVPLGALSSTYFSGAYDGQGHVISGLTHTSVSNSDIGLFTAVRDGGSVKNLTLKDVNIHRTSTDPQLASHVGALAGYLQESTVENVTVSGVVDGFRYVGLLSGLIMGSTVKNITVSGELGDVTLNDIAGGISGFVTNTQASHLRSSVTVRTGSAMGAGDGEFGGVFGTVSTDPSNVGTATVIDDVISTGAVTGRRTIGGAFSSINGFDVNGAKANITVTRVHTSGTVTGGGATGGVAGEILGGAGNVSVAQLSSTSEVNGSSSVGGVIGRIGRMGYGTEQHVSVRNSYATGKVTASYADAGGLIGSAQYLAGFSISNSYSTSSVTSPSGVGPVIATLTESTGTVEHSFWNATNSGLSSGEYGTELTQSAMKTVTPYAGAGWAIVDGWAQSGGESIWGICSALNNGFPFLLWMQETDACTLSAPNDVAVATGSTVATVTWKAPSDATERGLSGYEYRLGSSGTWIATGSTATTLKLTDLTNGEQYSISVRAMDGSRPGAASDPVTFTPNAKTQKITPAPKWPKTLLHPGSTVVFTKWMHTNAGQRVRPSATGVLLKGLRPSSDVRVLSTTLTKKGKFTVHVYTSSPVRVRITLTAKGTKKYAPLKQSKVYRLR